MKKQLIFNSTEYMTPTAKCVVLKSSSRFLSGSKIGTAGDDTTLTDEEW